MKQHIYRLLLFTLVLWCTATTVQAQNSYFSIAKGGLPHLPVFLNTAAVPAAALKPGAMIYSTSDANVMIYTGEIWDTFCSVQPALTTGGYSMFTVSAGLPAAGGGIPYLPIFKSTDVTSTTGKSGAMYMTSDAGGLRINNGANWLAPNYLTATTATTTGASAGNLLGLKGAFAFPVLTADPTFVATDKGAAYIRSTDNKLHVNNGTSWVAITCTCPSFASAALIDGDWNNMSLNGGYSFNKVVNAETAGSKYFWYIANDAAGAGAYLDPSSTTTTWTGYTDAIDGKYLQFKVIPSDGVLGIPASSSWYKLSNCPPQGSALVNDNIAAGGILSAGWSYYDKEQNPEDLAAIAYAWYKASDANGATSAAIVGATAADYTPADAEYTGNYYMQVQITPKATLGFKQGSAQASPWYQLPSNCPPQCTAVNVIGTPAVASSLSVEYNYYDKEENVENTTGTTYQWYRDNASTQISGATSSTYTPVAADRTHKLAVGVTVHAQKGYITGSEMLSAYTITIP